MAYHILSFVFATATVAVLLSLTFLLLWPPTVEPAVVVEEPNRTISDLVTERDYDVGFRVHNRTERTLRIVGMGIT